MIDNWRRKAAALAKTGKYSWRQIAEKLGIAKSTVSDFLRKHETQTAEPKTGPRILSLDIETSPLESYHWGLWQQNISLNQINNEWTILSFCCKWLGDDEVHYYDVSKQKDKRDDTDLVHKLWTYLADTDIVVAQNGKKFDIRKIKARMVMMGLPPLPPLKVFDTMLTAKAEFGFTSNKLEWMTDKLTKTKKKKHEKFPGFELWKQCLAGNSEAWAEMKEYNIDDVISLEELYLVLRGWSTGHPNVAAYYEDNDKRCPKCGSVDLHARGRQLTQSGEYQRYRCESCGGWSRSRYTLNSLAKRKSLLSN